MKIVDFILCDDIRNEMANKVSIIGAYNDRIEFLAQPNQEVKWPINIRLAFYCRLAREENDNEFDALEFTLHLEGEEIMNFKANVAEGAELSKPLILAFPIPGMKISGPGQLVPTVKVLSGENIVQELNPQIKFQITVREA